jgi:hypothetical protein
MVMSRSIKLSASTWYKIHQQLICEYPASVMLIRTNMKKRLGFTVREHREWVPKMDGGYWDNNSIHLDFYNEPKRTLFLLKYSDYLNDNN